MQVQENEMIHLTNFLIQELKYWLGLDLEKPKRQTKSEVVAKCDYCERKLTKRNWFYVLNFNDNEERLLCRKCRDEDVNCARFFGDYVNLESFRGWTAYSRTKMLQGLATEPQIHI